MWLPRPIMQRSPMLTTGSLTIFCPGTMPAERLTDGPISVSLPMWIQRCPKTAPSGKARQLPAPKDPNRRARPSPGPTAPLRATHSQVAWMAVPRIRRLRLGRELFAGEASPGCVGVWIDRSTASSASSASMASVRGSAEPDGPSGRGSVAVTPETLIAADPMSSTFPETTVAIAASPSARLPSARPNRGGPNDGEADVPAQAQAWTDARGVSCLLEEPPRTIDGRYQQRKLRVPL